MATKSAAKPAAKKTPTRASKAPAKKAPAKKAETAPVELTGVDDGVTIKIGDAHAEVKVNGKFDLDGLIAVTKRLDRARSELS